MTYYIVRLESDTEAPGISSIESNIDEGTYRALVDFLAGRVRLQAVPTQAPEPVEEIPPEE